MSTLIATLPKLAHDWLKHELDITFTRAAMVVASGAGVVVTGTVLGQITATKKLVPISFAAVDGSESAFGILLNVVDATAADVETACIVRDAKIVENQLVWPAGATSNQKTAALAQLAAKGIISHQR